MDSSDVLALAALIVSLVALLNTIFQVLQQYVATADGFRRCSASVMGDWARFTRRKFKWTELRFETIFATPTIFLDVAYDLKRVQTRTPGLVVVLDGSEEMSKWPGLRKSGPHERQPKHFAHQRWSSSSTDLEKPVAVQRRRTMSIPSPMGLKKFLRRNTPLFLPETPLEKFLALDKDPAGSSLDNEPVSWIPLMQSLQQYSESLVKCGLSTFQDVGSGSLLRGRILAPAVRISKKSWDFMPGEITKPLALTNIRDMVTMVQLLGCRWSSFKPEESFLRAEGDGIMVTSAEVRSLGTVVSFIKTDSRVEDRRELHGVVFSPFEGAATLGFGIIHSDLLGGETYRVYNLEDCQDTINHLSNSMTELTRLPLPLLQTVITDIVGILTPVYRPKDTAITYLVRPSEFVSDNFVSTRGPIQSSLSDTVVSCRGSMRSFTEKLAQILPHCDTPSECGASVKNQAHLRSIHRAAQKFLSCSRWHPDFGRPVITFKRYEERAVIELLESLHTAWDEATRFLSTHRVTTRATLSTHLSALLIESQKVVQIQRQAPLRYAKNAVSAQQELMHLYFDKCRVKCMDEVPRVAGVDCLIAEEVWITMLFRGICWHAIHNFDHRVVAVAPRYADSNLPIYIS